MIIKYRFLKTLTLILTGAFFQLSINAEEINPKHTKFQNTYKKNQPVYVAPLDSSKLLNNGYSVSNEEFEMYRLKALEQTHAIAIAKQEEIKNQYAKELLKAKEELRLVKNEQSSSISKNIKDKTRPEQIRQKAKIVQLQRDELRELTEARELAKAKYAEIERKLKEEQGENSDITNNSNNADEFENKASIINALDQSKSKNLELISQMKAQEASARKLLGLAKQSRTEQVECNFTDDKKRYYEKDGGYYFSAKKGKLEDNLKTLIKYTHPKHTYVFKLSRHNVFGDSCIFAISKDGLVQKMIEAYEEPSKIYFGTFPNTVAAFFYEGSEIFNKYVRYTK
jgi:hypothetical protein